MKDENKFDGMPLALVLQRWMDLEGWSDEIEINEDRTVSSVATEIWVDSQDFRIYLEAFESDHRLFIYLYTNFKTPRQRMDVMSRILNRINFRLAFGRLACDDGSEPRSIQFKASIDVKGSSLCPAQIDTLVGMAGTTFRTYGSLLAMCALSHRSTDDLWREFTEQEAGVYVGGSMVPRVLN